MILTSGLSLRNVLLTQLMADILGRDVQVPKIAHATAVSAAIHGAVVSGLVADYVEGLCPWVARRVRLHYRPRPEAWMPYQVLFYGTRSASSVRMK